MIDAFKLLGNPFRILVEECNRILIRPIDRLDDLNTFETDSDPQLAGRPRRPQPVVDSATAD
jgi:hypothetical protein